MAYELRIRQRYGNNQDAVLVGRYDLKRDAMAAGTVYPADLYEVEVAAANEDAAGTEPAAASGAPAEQSSELEQLRAEVAAMQDKLTIKDAELAAVRADANETPGEPTETPEPARGL